MDELRSVTSSASVARFADGAVDLFASSISLQRTPLILCADVEESAGEDNVTVDFSSADHVRNYPDKEMH